MVKSPHPDQQNKALGRISPVDFLDARRRSAALAAYGVVEPADAEPAVIERVERDGNAAVTGSEFQRLDEIL